MSALGRFFITMTDENKVSLLVKGKRYSGWLNVQIEAELMNLARSFSVGVTRQLNQSSLDIGIDLGDEVVVSIGSDVVLTGYVTNINIKYSARSVQINIKGFSKTIDLIECCLPTGTPKSYKNLTLLKLLSQLAGVYGIGVIDQVGIADKVSLDMKPTDKIGDALVDLLKKKSYLLCDDENGNLVVCKPGSEGSCSDSLVYGQNILSGHKTLKAENLFSQYVVIGQGANPDSTRPITDNQLKREATNPDIRNRTIVIGQSGNAFSDEMQKRVNHYMAQSKATSNEVLYEVHGWRQSSRALWKLNQLIAVNDSFLGIKSRKLISKITYSLSEKGLLTLLKVDDPDAFLNTEAKTTGEAVRVTTENGRLIAIGHVEGTDWTS